MWTAESRGRYDRSKLRYPSDLTDEEWWAALPKDLPPKSTVYDYFDLWSWDRTLDRIHEALYVGSGPIKLNSFMIQRSSLIRGGFHE